MPAILQIRAFIYQNSLLHQKSTVILRKLCIFIEKVMQPSPWLYGEISVKTWAIPEAFDFVFRKLLCSARRTIRASGCVRPFQNHNFSRGKQAINDASKLLWERRSCSSPVDFHFIWFLTFFPATKLGTVTRSVFTTMSNGLPRF